MIKKKEIGVLATGSEMYISWTYVSEKCRWPYRETTYFRSVFISWFGCNRKNRYTCTCITHKKLSFLSKN